jgi:hypothetical protein
MPVWKTHQDAAGRFSFEYPAAYDSPAYRDQCAPRESEDGLMFGMRSELGYIDSGDASLAESADRLLREKDWREESRAATTISGQPALTVAFRFGGTNRYGEFTLVPANGRLLVLGFSAGALCDIPEAGMTEFKAYQHARASFRFAR